MFLKLSHFSFLCKNHLTEKAIPILHNNLNVKHIYATKRLCYNFKIMGNCLGSNRAMNEVRTLTITPKGSAQSFPYCLFSCFSRSFLILNQSESIHPSLLLSNNYALCNNGQSHQPIWISLAHKCSIYVLSKYWNFRKETTFLIIVSTQVLSRWLDT